MVRTSPHADWHEDPGTTGDSPNAWPPSVCGDSTPEGNGGNNKGHMRATPMLRAATILLLIGVMLAVTHWACLPMEETDLFFHLKLGEIILSEGKIPFRNLFSFTYPDHPDPDLAWAFQLAVALAFRGGFGAIVLLKTLLVVSAFGLVLAASLRRSGSACAAGLAMLLAAVAAEQRIVERPHLVTFVGLGILALALDWLTARPKRLFVLGCLVVLWANFHAGVFLAPLMVGAYAVGLLIEARRTQGCERRAFEQQARYAGLGALVACGAACLSPGGFELPSYLAWHTGLGATRTVEEFRRAELPSDPFFFAMLLGVALTLVGLRDRTPWRWALPVVAVAPLAWLSVRFVAEWAILAGPLVALGCARALHYGLVGASRLCARQGQGTGPSFSQRVRRRLCAWQGKARLTLLLGMGTSLILYAGHGLVTVGGRLGLHPEVVPFDAIAFVTETGLRERMFSNLDVGCYLLWEGWPRYRVFQDARLPAYPDEFHRALDDLSASTFHATLARFGVDAALLSEAGVNVRAGSFDPDTWALVYMSPNWKTRGAFVFAKRVRHHERVIAMHEIPLRPRFTMEKGTWVEPLWEPPAASPVPQCEWHRRLTRALQAEGYVEAAEIVGRAAKGAGCP